MKNAPIETSVLRQLLRSAFLVAAGAVIMLLAQMGLPRLGLARYGSAFRTAYFDCERANDLAAELNKLPLETALSHRLHTTIEIDQLSCLDYRALRYRLQQLKVSSASLNLMEIEVDTGVYGTLPFYHQKSADEATLDRKLQKVVDFYGLRPITIRRYVEDPIWKLGQALFFDPVLSGNRDVSCATCHLLQYGLSDGLPRSIGTNGEGLGPDRRLSRGIQIHPRHSLDLWNRDNNDVSAFFWDGHVEVVNPTKRLFRSPLGRELPKGFDNAMAVQAVFPITIHDEMLGYFGERSSSALPAPHGNKLNDLVVSSSYHGEIAKIQSVHDRILKRLLARDSTPEPWQLEYRALFHDAFPQKSLREMNIVDLGNALSHFEERAFASANSAWDRYIGGDPKAISKEAKVGAIIFFGKGRCAACHSGPLFSDFKYHGVGIFNKIYEDGKYVYDTGRGAVTGNPLDNYHFRTSPLRNVTRIGPYFHDGSTATLMDALVRHLEPLAKTGTYNPDGSHAIDKNQADSVSPILASDIKLTKDEIKTLVAFLGALDAQSRSREQIIPARVPSGIPISH
jgi:cytochrome c peroxidase